MKYKRTINFDDREQKREVLRRIGALTGKWDFEAKPSKPLRSTKANAYYWSQVATSFQEFMRGHGQYFELEEVHEFLLAKYGSKPVIDPTTGEVMHSVGKRSSKMNSGEFADFVNFCMEWMFDRFGIVVPEPDAGAKWRNKRAA